MSSPVAPTIARAGIVRGYGVVGFNSEVFYAKEEITLGPGLETYDLSVDAFGKISKRVKGRAQKISFIPAGMWAALATLFPYGDAVPGSSAFGSDTPAFIQTKAGQQILFNAGCITKMPSIIGSSSKTMLGPCEILCIGSDNTDWATANSLYTISTTAFADTSFDPTQIITDQWSIALGTVSGFTNIPTKDGFTIDFELDLEDVTVDGQGVVDKTFISVTAIAKFIPVGISEADLYALLGLQDSTWPDAGGAVPFVPGLDLNTGANTLTFAGVNSGKTIVLNGAVLVDAPMKFGVKATRVGEVAFMTTRNFTSGVMAPCFTVA